MRAGRWVVAGMMLLCGGMGRAQQPLLLPSAVAYDAAGDLFFVDTNRHQVFEMSLAGVLTTVAGNGVQGFGGDGGAATAAMLNAPQGVAVGSDGTVYVSDTGNHRVRAVVGGVIATVVGTGAAGFGGDGGAATAALLRGPTGLTMDASGALMICDTGNQRVRRVSAGVIATVVGNGIQGFGGDGGVATGAMLDTPVGVGVAGDGRVFVADSHNHRVRVVTAGVIATFAGTGVRGFGGDGGAATAAMLNLPRGVSVDATGGVVFADSDNQRVRRVDANGVIATVAGSGVQGFAADGAVGVAAALDTPRGVGTNGVEAVAFADSPNKLVREVAANGVVYTVAVLNPARVSDVQVSVAGSVVYGDAAVSVSVSGAAVPQGGVMVSESGAVVGSAMLKSGGASVGLGLMPAGMHGLVASYAGDGLNPAAVSGVTTVQVMQAPSTVTMMPVQGSYAGMPLVLSAKISPVFTGIPSGVVNFMEAGNAVASGSVVNGVATGTWLSPSAGTHSLTAVYAGDGNFLGSSSGVMTASVGAMADFSVVASGGTQSVQGGLIAAYPLTISSVDGVFSGVVTFSVAGLQKGAVATFLPVAVVPGASGAAVTMSVQTVALSAKSLGWTWVLAMPLVIFMGRKRWRRCGSIVVVSGVVVGLGGCGARTVSEGVAASQTYALTVTATGTNLAGAVVVHTTQVGLVVR